jgi:hypothetical protein
MSYKKKYEELAKTAAEVYERITGGAIWKVNASALDVIMEFENFYERKFVARFDEEQERLDRFERELNSKEDRLEVDCDEAIEDGIMDFKRKVINIDSDQGDTIEDFKQRIANL